MQFSVYLKDKLYNLETFLFLKLKNFSVGDKEVRVCLEK